MHGKTSMGEALPPSPDQTQFRLRPYFLILLKRRLLILVLLGSIALLGTAYTLLQTPLYLSTAVLYVHQFTLNIVPQVVSESQGNKRGDTFLQNQFTLMKSKTMATSVVKRLNLKSTDLIPQKKKAQQPASDSAMSEEDLDRTANAVLRMLRVTPMKNTTFFQIDFVTPDPKLSMTLANAWVEEYVNYNTTARLEINEEVKKLVSDQVKELQKDIQQKQQLLEELGLQDQVVNIDKDRPMDMYALEELTNALTKLKQDRIAKKVHYETLLVGNYHAIPEISGSQVINQLKAQHSELERIYAEKSRLYQADYPEMVRLQSQMTQIQQRIKQETNDLYSKVVAAAKSNYEQAIREEAALQRQITETKRETIEGRRHAGSYEQLEVELDKKKKVLEGLLTKQSETDVSADLDEQAATIRVVQQAELPRVIYSPKTTRNILFSLLIGLSAGILAAFVFEFFDTSLKSSDDVKHVLRLPVMGVVPRHQAGEGIPTVRFFSHSSNHKGSDLVLLQDPTSIASEALRTVRTSLILNSDPRTLLVTSTRGDEGKTFVAANLAISLVQVGKRVVLVDADMRNPRQHRIWNVRNNPGLGRFLNQQASLSEALRLTGVEGLSLIPSDSRLTHQAELLSSKKFDELITALTQEFDYVIVDSPPVLPVSDAIILGGKCGHAILVVRGGSTPRDIVEMAMDRLAQSDAVILGVVLNCVDFSDPYYYYSYYANKNYVYSYPKTNKAT